MRIVEAIAIAVLILLAGLVVLYARREIIARGGGTIEMNMRLSTYVPGRGWAPGLGRFTADQLRWYRVFSLAVRPRRVLVRNELAVEERRRPEGPELLVLPDGWIVVRCRGRSAADAKTAVEFALAESALTGFLSWLESAPPGVLRQR
jgi:hypothetical protein